MKMKWIKTHHACSRRAFHSLCKIFNRTYDTSVIVVHFLDFDFYFTMTMDQKILPLEIFAINSIPKGTRNLVPNVDRIQY